MLVRKLNILKMYFYIVLYNRRHRPTRNEVEHYLGTNAIDNQRNESQVKNIKENR